MGGGRAVSDSIVPLVTQPGLDKDAEMQALLETRRRSAFRGAEESYHIEEKFLACYNDFGGAVSRVKAASERSLPVK